MHFIRIAGPQLAFSAAHFITLADGVCESLHGHDYRVSVEVWDALGPHQYVVDYVALEKLVLALLAEWDHAVLLPRAHPAIRVEEAPGELTIAFGDRRWILPRADCRWLPVANTTTECLAELLALRLHQQLESQLHCRPKRLKLEIGEGLGRSAGFEIGAPE